MFFSLGHHLHLPLILVLVLLQRHPPHLLPLGRQDVLNVPLPLQVGPPAKVVGDQVVVAAALTPGERKILFLF